MDQSLQNLCITPKLDLSLTLQQPRFLSLSPSPPSLTPLSSTSSKAKAKGAEKKEKMNLTLFVVAAPIILDMDGNRVISKYYRQETGPSFSKDLANIKEP